MAQKKPPDQKKSENIQINFTPVEYKQIEAMRHKVGRSSADYIRRIVFGLEPPIAPKS